ncbi:aminopeptidase P N-terminal domain-containing protein [Pontimicrobium sp. IMCC45349]|uniref:aminopeptidase P family protein n=1 Tax=Pontimicrobium sp. IMCC45349 TaxID=3391574 RepID=UPI0039A171AF
MKIVYSLIFTLCFSVSLFAQDQVPTDFLSKEFHKERRDVLRSKMPANSVAVVFANPLRNRANDVDYVFHQDPNFYYLTGYREPNGVLVLFSDEQTDANGNTYTEILYVQEKNATKEMWDGKRLGKEEAIKTLGVSKAKNAIEFIISSINFSKFSQVFIDGKFKDDYRNTSNKAEIFDLVESFKLATNYNPKDYPSKAKVYLYNAIAKATIEEQSNIVSTIKKYQAYYPELLEDAIIQNYLQANDKTKIEDAQQQVSLVLGVKQLVDVSFLPEQLAAMREIKTAEELKLLTKAIRISAIGQIEVMKAMQPHMSEAELQGIHEFVYKKYGVAYEGYPSIVGAGNNGCILHYIENDRTKVGNDLVLMDLGAEYRAYTADVTRTIPANGKFTKEQKLIYDLVFKAQEAGIKATVVGAPFRAPNNITKEIINKGLFELGIIDAVDARHNYYPHGSSHYLGLDVHDPGTRGNLQANSVITVEPGIYIPDGSPCDEKWWGIAVRIEDDILITENGPVNLSAEAPRTSEAIEEMMAQPSVLNSFVLPSLDD